MIPIIIGIKSPIRFIDGRNSIGNANNSNTMAVAEMMVMDFGRCIFAILICSYSFNGVELRSAIRWYKT